LWNFNRSVNNSFKVMATRLDNPTITRFLLEVCEEILFYNEQSAGYKPELHTKMAEGFYDSGIVDVVSEILRNRNEESKIAFTLLVLAFSSDERWNKLLEDNSTVILSFLDDPQSSSTADETRLKIVPIPTPRFPNNCFVFS
jgi:hypothetical protein